MGNAPGKESRSSHHQGRSDGPNQTSPPLQSPTLPSSRQRHNSGGNQAVYLSRHGRGSGPDISALLGIAPSADRDSAGLEQRRETKAEREAKKLERERITREKERERSMREESVDGGFLVTQGVYTGPEDYNKVIVRQLMIERRIGPFWRGLNDHDESWTENQLVAAAKGLPIPAADEIPVEESPRILPKSNSKLNLPEPNINHLTVPISSRSQSFNSDTSSNLSPSQASFQLPVPSMSTTSILRGRAKTLASLTTSSRNSPQAELLPREVNLPHDPYVNGQRLEVYMYKDATECPICFLYYPPYLNHTRCCDQAICSECFVQIKRPDPHPPEHSQPLSAPAPTPTAASPPSEHLESDPDGTFISEPAACPFCKQPEFGITFQPPPFRKGLVYLNPGTNQPVANMASPMSSSSSLHSMGAGNPIPAHQVERRRAASLSANAPTVITTDRVRPDWATKLASARAHAARRSAAATALHTAAYLMNTHGGASDSRGFGFGRRGMLRRGTGSDSPTGSSANLAMLALMAERYGGANRVQGPGNAEGVPTLSPPPRDSSRRNRVDDLEEMMMMEAIRLSLAAEEDRRKRDEKDMKKEAKKKAKEDKKAEKSGRKAGLSFSSSNNQSSASLAAPYSAGLPYENGSKGKEIARTGRDEAPDVGNPSQLSRSMPTEGSNGFASQTHLERSRALLHSSDAFQSAHQPMAASSAAYKPSHLRNLSNVSSSVSSLVDQVQDLHGGEGASSMDVSPSASGLNLSRASGDGTPAGGGAGLEPMFNFRSLAEMIDRDEKAALTGSTSHEENAEATNGPSVEAPQEGTMVDLTSNAQGDEANGVRPDSVRSDDTIVPTTLAGVSSIRGDSKAPQIEMAHHPGAAGREESVS
ncbi:SNF1-interacting protein [Agyrium rufum]|nr:SNF1-interacting protein [Agyrium rufum]